MPSGSCQAEELTEDIGDLCEKVRLCSKGRAEDGDGPWAMSTDGAGP